MRVSFFAVSLAFCAVLALLFGLRRGLWARAGKLAPEEVKTKADQGDASAQAALGFRYEAGDGVPEEVAEAIKWYRKAAEQGDAAAAANRDAIRQRMTPDQIAQA